MKVKDILASIEQIRNKHEHDFTSGDCGEFAIALAKFLTENKIPCEYLVEYGSHYEMYDHVAVSIPKFRKHFDGTGLYKKKRGMQYDDDEDYKVEYMNLPINEESEDSIRRFTDNQGVFAYNEDSDVILSEFKLSENLKELHTLQRTAG